MFREDFALDVAAYPRRGEICAGKDERSHVADAAYTALTVFSTSSFSPLNPGERDDQSFSASGTVLRPPGRQAATMQPWYP